MKNIFKALPVVFLLMLVSCADKYQQGFDEGMKEGQTDGYNAGYDQGKADGDAASFESAKEYFLTADYDDGVADGRNEALPEGYANGYTVGKNETYQPSYNQGYSAGYSAGTTPGYNSGYNAGVNDGKTDQYNNYYNQGYNASYSSGYSDGQSDGYNLGYSDGYDSGYSSGNNDGYWDSQSSSSSDDYSYDSSDDSSYSYDDSYDDSYDYSDSYDSGYYDDWGYYDDYSDYGFSVGKSKPLKGYANLLSMAHNDMFDYKKIERPRSTKKGLVVKGKLLLSETSLTNKDTLKRAAVIEQYLVLEMAKQVQSKFGLSSERSLKVAKAANHFRKQSSRRALTSEDTDAYATELIGSNFNELSDAYKDTLKGDTDAFQQVLDKASKKNDISPEKVSLILTQYFI